MKNLNVVAAIIVKDDKILAAKRSYGDFANFWEFPGSKIEVNETKEEAIVREIKEEMNVDIKVKSYLTTVNCQYPKYFLNMHCFICELKNNEEIINSNSHNELKWLSLDELQSMNWLEADVFVVKKIKETFK